MIRQQIGDLLEVQEDRKYYYIVVLTKVVMFGGNIVFAFHNDGELRELENLRVSDGGFNICSDLLLAKREKRVRRLHRFADVSPFWRTSYVKATNQISPGKKANHWYISRTDQLGCDFIDRVTELTPEYRKAMDSGCHSFDLVAMKVLRRYTPDQNEHL